MPSGSGAMALLPPLSSGKPKAAALPSSFQDPVSVAVINVTFAPTDGGEPGGKLLEGAHSANAGSFTADRTLAFPTRPVPSEHTALTVAMQPPGEDTPMGSNASVVETPALPAVTDAEANVAPTRDTVAADVRESA